MRMIVCEKWEKPKRESFRASFKHTHTHTHTCMCAHNLETRIRQRSIAKSKTAVCFHLLTVLLNLSRHGFV